MTFFTYFAQVSLYAAIMLGIYCIVWRNRPLHFYSRLYLLASLAIPAVLPFLHVPAAVREQIIITGYSTALPEIGLGTAGNTPGAGAVTVHALLMLLYLAGCVLFAVLYLRAYRRLHKKLQQGQSIQYADHTIITGTGIGPGTLGTRIFFPAAHTDPVIVQHELAHIQARHRYDAFFLQAMQVIFWASPAHWFIGRELKMVHEFEADRVASKETDITDYASLLLSQSFGSAHPFVIAQSFFHHPLKRRIMMLQKMNAPKRNILLLAAFVLTAGFMSTVLLAQTRKQGQGATAATPVTDAVSRYPDAMRNYPRQSGEVRTLADGTIAFKTADKMPAFNGNMREWLLKNMRYPDPKAEHDDRERAVVQFTVTAEGQIMKPELLQSSGNKAFDEEAVRAVSNMPAWKPGIQQGKPVTVLCTLPISFNPDQPGC